MDSIREAETGEAVSCAVSLDGVMVPLRPDGGEEACWREASCGTVSFQDAEGNRLKTLSFGPEVGKATLKAQLAEEIAHVRKVRPELVAVADAAPDNWTFLEKLRPDEQAVDFFHACEHLSEVSDHAVASNWYEKYRAARRRRRHRQGHSGAISATRRRQNRNSRFSGANSGFSASTDAACATQASRPTAARSGVVRQQGPGQPAHETGALEHEVRMSSPSLMRSDRFEQAWRLGPRTKIRCRTPSRLDGESPAVKTGSLAKIDPHPPFTWTAASANSFREWPTRPCRGRPGRRASCRDRARPDRGFAALASPGSA